MTEKITYTNAILPLLLAGADTTSSDRLTFELESYIARHHLGGITFDLASEARQIPKDPREVALNKIEQQCNYWSLLPDYLLDPKTTLYDVIRMNLLVLEPYVDMTGWDIERIHRNIIEERQRKSSSMPKRFRKINCLGDADFYGADQNAIFPMQVRVQDASGRATIARVPIEELGVDRQLVQKTWDSWNTVTHLFDQLEKTAWIGLLKELNFPLSLIYRLENLPYAVNVWVYLATTIQSRQTLNQMIAAAKTKNLRPIIEETGQNHPLVVATRELVQNLQNLYQTARHHVDQMK